MRDRSDLFAYQRKAVEFIKEHPNCALWVEMGLGKTVSAATAFADLQEAFEARRMLVIGPLRVARKVWRDEFKEWSHLNHLHIEVAAGVEARQVRHVPSRLAMIRRPSDVTTINMENVPWLIDQFITGKKQFMRWPWDLVVIDESQGFRNQSSQRFKSLLRIRKLFPRCVELTGTPAPNGYGNLWSQLKLLDGGARLGRTEKDFRDRWFTPERGDGYVTWHIKDHAPSEIQRAVSDIVLSLRVEDYFDLPPVKWNPVRVALTAPELATYRKFERTYIAEVAGRVITAVSAGVLFGKLAQLANGSIYVDNQGNFELFHDKKIDALLEVLDGASGPVIIGYSFRADAVRIAKALDRYCGKEKKWAKAESDEDLNRFAQGELDYLLVHPASCGHGNNDMHLSGAETIVHFGFGPNLEWFQQLNARLIGGIRRIGKNVVIHMLVAEGTKDDDMMNLLTHKATTQDDLTRAMVVLSKEKI